MTKVSLEIKIKAVEEYLSGTEVKAVVARKYDIGRMLFRVLVGIYEKHGRKGLLNPPLVTGKFRIKLVECSYPVLLIMAQLFRNLCTKY
uniref:helix-turn-helix domain-containing protein n=1 Tax=Lentilactobacillus hilgardii TaxID=1588 RepID=UPI00403F75A0